jgi:hypothetical protein
MTGERRIGILEEKHDFRSARFVELIRYSPDVKGAASQPTASDHPPGRDYPRPQAVQPLPIPGVNHQGAAGAKHGAHALNGVHKAGSRVGMDD